MWHASAAACTSVIQSRARRLNSSDSRIWSTGARAIPHPENLHYSGNLVFGADGMLYIGTGDGGEPNDASHQAQTTTSLLELSRSSGSSHSAMETGKRGTGNT